MSGARISGDGSTVYNGITVNTPYENAKDEGVKVEDFLNLMIAQMTNQDFMNPADDTQYVTQMAQFATMQSMQELSQYSQTNYVSSLVGKTVTVATLSLGGSVNKDTGVVSGVNLSGDTYTVTVNGKEYELSQIMAIEDTAKSVTVSDLEKANGMSLYIQKETEGGASIRWDAPVSDETKAGTLSYSVYITKDGTLNFDEMSGVKKGELEASGLKKTEYEITGLEKDTTYFVNIVVKNSAGDEAIYKQTEIRT